MRYLVLAVLLVLTACAGGSDITKLEPVEYSDLPSWKRDAHAEALQTFVNSCMVNARRPAAWTNREGTYVGDPESWRQACHQAQQYILPTNDEARIFFESHFAPYRVTTGIASRGLITGYYEPLLHGSTTPQGVYQTPVYGVPRGDKHFSRAEINAGALHNKAPILLYVEDPVMLFFLHIQGSGKVRLTDGSIVGLQYAGQNGYEYVAIGRVLKDMGELEEVSMQTIRDWLHQNPDKARAVMEQNPSYIFFKLSPGEQYAKGALGIPLTPQRSIAIDDDRATYGVPTYIATTRAHPSGMYNEKYRRLFVSQDTGGALHGPHRADIFYGRGELEEWLAGQQNSRGKVYWLLPKTPQPPLF